MASKRKSSRKKGRSATRFGLEILAICILLVVAAYVGNWGKSTAPSPRPAATSKVEKKQEVRRPSEKSVKAASAGKSGPVLDKNEYRLARLSDGDSFVLEDSRKRTVKVRLYGVDAPEGKQSFGNGNSAEDVCIHRYACNSCEDNTKRIVLAKHLYDNIFGNPIMDNSTDADTYKHIGSNLFSGGNNLLPRIFHTVTKV